MTTPMLLCADAVVTMAADRRTIPFGAVLVEGERIAAVGTQADLVARYPQAALRQFGRAVLMPGLVNTHCHSGLLRGTAEGLPVWDWLRVFIDPMHRVLQPWHAEAASWLCYAENLLAGTTTVVDMWRHMDGSARAAEALGQRVVMVPYVGAAPGYDYFDTLDDNARLIERWHGAAGGRIQAWVGLEHENYTTEAACRRAVAMCRHHGVGLHTHSNESHVEYAEAERRHGLTPVRALERLGLLDPERVLLAHCVWLQADELACLAAHGVGVAHNPTSNMKLASGTAPVAEMLAAGLAVGLGSDGEKENNNLDLFEEMKIASLLAKLRHLDAAAFDAWEVLHCATLGGARALGMQDQIGSLEVGKQADIVAVRADTPRMTPFLKDGPFMNLHHNLVHAVQGGDVTMTMVAGRVLVEDGQLRSGHLPDCIAQAETACADLLLQRQDWLGRQAHGMQVAT